MKHKVSFFIILLVAMIIPQSVQAYDFSAVSPGGQTLYYSYNNGSSGSSVSVTYPGQDMFSLWSGYTMPIGSLVIPNSVTNNGHTYTVTRINPYAFADCSGLTSVTIPNTVTHIFYNAFCSCSGLTSIMIPNSVTEIGEGAFSACSGLTSIVVDSNNSNFDSRNNCNAIILKHYNTLIAGCQNTIIPSTVTCISSEAFYSCTGLTSITIPNSVTNIGECAFYGCSGLTGSLTIPNSVTSIGDRAFYGCTGLTSPLYNNTLFVYMPSSYAGNYTIPNGITTICSYAFYNCSGLTSVTIPNSVTNIETSAFSDCIGLTSVTIPSTVVSIGIFAFLWVRHIEYHGTATGSSWGALHMNGITEDSIIYSDSTKTSIWSYIGSGGTVTIPSTVTCIGNSAFRNCDGLTSVVFNADSCYSAGSGASRAFYGCTNISSITIGNNVKIVPPYLFDDCDSITSVTMCSSVPPVLGTRTFPSYYYPITIPCGSYSAYYAHANWNGYRSRLQYFYPSIDINTYANDTNKDHASVSLQENHFVYCDSTAIIQAIPSYGYHFAHWSNGRTANPDTLQLVSDSTVMAIFVPDTFLVHVTVNYSNRGVATISDSLVAYLDSVNISATANYGYHFTRWNDNDTNVTRRVRVTQNATYTAQFDYNQYQLTLNVDNSVHGSVSNGGTYNYLSVRTIFATANYGYHFDHWSDGDTNSTRTIVLTQDTSLTAYFANNQYAVIGIPNNSTYGTVSGSDTVDYLDTVVLTATANTNYYFSRWSDGITVNPRAIVASGNHTVTAYFNPVQFTLMVASCDTSMGRVSGGGNYDYLSNRTISAIANSGYHFTQWNDGVTSQSRIITLTQDTSFTAFFAPNQYTLTLLNANPDMGSVEGGGTYDYQDTVIISATAVEHHHFVQWSDGNRDNPRQYLITGDAFLTANFAIDTHTVNISANDIARGSVSSTGTRFVYGTPCTVTATAYTGYTFVKWSNGVTANPYTFAVMNDMELTAIFLSPDELCTVTVVSANPSMGAATVDGGSSTTVMSGEGVSLTATPFAGYRFVQWQDDDTHSHRTVTVTSTITYTAYFAPLASIREAEVNDGFRVFAQGGQIVVEGAEAMPVMLYDATGRLLATRRNEDIHGSTPLRFEVPASGTYLIKVGNLPARKVVVIR